MTRFLVLGEAEDSLKPARMEPGSEPRLPFCHFPEITESMEHRAVRQ